MVSFLQRLYKRDSLRQDSLLLFLVCAAVYLSNQKTISANDTIPNTLLAFNLILKHTIHFDAFRDSYFGKAYFFAEGFNGHLTSSYPIGVAVLTFPLYLLFSLFFWVLKFVHEEYLGIDFDINLLIFENYRLGFEKLAATTVAATSVVIFYLISRLIFRKSTALISTFIYAFASETWVISSQGLWQHGPGNLAVLLIIFCLLKANRTEGRTKKLLLFAAGLLCGLLPGIRPSNVLFSIAAIAYSIYIHRRNSIFLLLGLPSVMLCTAWDIYYYNHVLGSYGLMAESLYSFTLQRFIGSGLGTLISPSRGFLIFTPIVFYVIPGTYYIFKHRSNKDEQLLLCMLFASAALFFSYCFYKDWWAGWCYGPRFMTDTLPAVCLSLNYYIREHISYDNRRFFTRGAILFTLLVLLSTFPQVVGAFGTTTWDSIPVPSENRNRLWKFEDSQVERHARNLFFQTLNLPFKHPSYLQNLQGAVLQVMDVNNQPIKDFIAAEPDASVLLKAEVRNTGKARWFGYETGILNGESRVRVQFWNRDDQLVREERLYVSGMPKPGDATRALGFIHFPAQAGIYRLAFDLVLEGVGQIPTEPNRVPYTLEARVENQDSPSQVSPTRALKAYAQDIKVSFLPSTAKSGSTLNLPVSVRNTSDFSWDSDKIPPVRLSYHWIKADGSMEVFEGERTELPFKVSPGDSVALNAKIKVPERTGTYTLQLSMVEESVAWFEKKGAQPLDIKVKLSQ